MTKQTNKTSKVSNQSVVAEALEATLPKGYKASPLGIIPEDWEVKELGQIFEYINTPSFSRENLTYEDLYHGVRMLLSFCAILPRVYSGVIVEE